ncbi:hypothetical protein [Marinobacterium sp. BA1]|uniref:hypothetical protein n=1 Tax=Marinobacterium sp. BA1 TaxID=3138931 RepID=UPI0032E7AE81
MGKWQQKVRALQHEQAYPEGFVSSVSTLPSVSAKKSRDAISVTEPDTTTPVRMLYRATDLMPELALIVGARDDVGFIDNILAGMSGRERHQLLSGYREVWLQAIEAKQPKPHEIDNVGRKHANRWLYGQAAAKEPATVNEPSDLTNDFGKIWSDSWAV